MIEFANYVTIITMVTQADIDTLNAAIASGARSVTIGGQTITYNTTDSLIRARNDMLAELERQNPEAKRVRKVYAVYGGRGYNR